MRPTKKAICRSCDQIIEFLPISEGGKDSGKISVLTPTGVKVFEHSTVADDHVITETSIFCPKAA